MIITSAFEGLLVPERHRRKAARDGGFSIPTLEERRMDLADEPFLISNSRGSFLRMSLLSNKTVRYGFWECSIEDESVLMMEFYRTLWTISEKSGWGNRCSSIAQAKSQLESYGLLPRTLIVPLATLGQVCGQEVSLEDARKLTVAQGCVAEVDGVRVQFSDLPEGLMIMATTPPLVGVYTRVDDYLGLMFRKIDQSVVLINELAR